MAKIISDAERKILYTKIYHELGYPVREVEITDEQMDTLFENALENYSKFINDWLIDQQWSTISGLDIEDADFNVAFSTKDLNFVRSFSYSYSKQVGLGTNAPAGDSWELKKDFVVLSAHTQYYNIPKGREVNEVLWYTPSFTVYDTLNPIGMGFESLGAGWAYNGTQMGVIQPSYSTMLASADRALKSKLIKSEMSYRITGNADGSKTLHLYPVPGGPFVPKGLNYFFNPDVDGMYVWYWYYETNSKNKNKCLKDNGDIAVVTRPSDAPIDNLTWDKLNKPARTWIRQYLLANAKTLLGYIRGKYSGKLDVTDATVIMDYSFLIEEGKTEREGLTTELKDRLDGLTYEHQLEKRGNEAEQLNRVLGYIPLPILTF